MFSSSNIRNPSLEPICPITYTLGRFPDPPPCTCPECLQQYRTVDQQRVFLYIYSGAINDEKAEDVCTKMIQDININRAFLQRELKLRSAGITKRWKKKSLKKREDLLKFIVPDMYDRKWHEAQIQYDARYKNIILEARKHQNIHLLPYMSLENLKEDPSRLIKLLHHRTKYSPADLAVADNRRLSFGWTTGILEATFNRCAIVMHGSRYGSLSPWVRDEVHRGDSIGFPRGQLILKAQSQLLSILRGVVEVLIDGLPEEGESAVSPGLGLPVLSNVGEGTVYVDEAFSSCPIFDLEKLAEISNDRLKSERDHLCHLQTDPAYLRRYVRLIQTSGYSRLPENITFIMTTEDLDYEAWTIRHWSWISENISELKQIQARFADRINRGQVLPAEYSDKLASFEALILHLLDIQSRHIQCVFPYRPGFQDHYDFQESSIATGILHLSHSFKDRSDDPLEQALSNREAFVKDPLHWCIASLTTNPDAPMVWDKFRLLEFLDQHLGKATAEERARIDETLLRKISNLAAFNELLALVRSYRPRAVQRGIAELRATDQSLAWRFMSKTMMKPEFGDYGKQMITQRTLQEIPLDFFTLGQLLKTFMDQEPMKDMSDRGGVTTKEIAQQNALRRFWDFFRRQHQKRLKEAGISHTDIVDDLNLISADLDPDFLAAFEAERKELFAKTVSLPSRNQETKYRPRQATSDTNIRREMHTQGIVEPVNAPTSSKSLRRTQDGKVDTNPEVQTEWGTTPIVTKPTGETKTKPKTRGEALPIDQKLFELDVTTDHAQEQPVSDKVPVKKSALEVFSSLFARRGGSTGILWDRFVDAMAKLGFMSRHSGGSAVTFEPSGGSKWYGQGAIVFHRPHPDSTIDPVMLNSIGKRMNKWFGWGKETFELGK